MVTDGLLSLLLPTVPLTEGLSYKRFVCKGHSPLIDVQTRDTDQQGACKDWGEVSRAPRAAPIQIQNQMELGMGVLDTAAGVPTVLFVSICTLG